MYQVVAVAPNTPATARLKLAAFPTKHEAQAFAVGHSHPDIEVVNEKTQLLVGWTRQGDWVEPMLRERRDIA